MIQSYTRNINTHYPRTTPAAPAHRVGARAEASARGWPCASVFAPLLRGHSQGDTDGTKKGGVTAGLGENSTRRPLLLLLLLLLQLLSLRLAGTSERYRLEKPREGDSGDGASEAPRRRRCGQPLLPTLSSLPNVGCGWTMGWSCCRSGGGGGGCVEGWR